MQLDNLALAALVVWPSKKIGKGKIERVKLPANRFLKN